MVTSRPYLGPWLLQLRGDYIAVVKYFTYLLTIAFFKEQPKGFDDSLTCS